MKKSEPQPEGSGKSSQDAHLAAAEFLVPGADHAVRAAHLGLHMINALAPFHERSGTTLQVHMGINSGAVVADVIGKRKFMDDLWGATVNAASRGRLLRFPLRKAATPKQNAEILRFAQNDTSEAFFRSLESPALPVALQCVPAR